MRFEKEARRHVSGAIKPGQAPLSSFILAEKDTEEQRELANLRYGLLGSSSGLFRFSNLHFGLEISCNHGANSGDARWLRVHGKGVLHDLLVQRFQTAPRAGRLGAAIRQRFETMTRSRLHSNDMKPLMLHPAFRIALAFSQTRMLVKALPVSRSACADVGHHLVIPFAGQRRGEWPRSRIRKWPSLLDELQRFPSRNHSRFRMPSGASRHAIPTAVHSP
jgi:hypothetical protein